MYLIVQKEGMLVYDLTPEEEADAAKEKPDTGNKTFPISVGIHKCEQVPSLANKDGSGVPWIVLKGTRIGASLCTWEQLVSYGIWGAKFVDTDQPGGEEIPIKWRKTPEPEKSGDQK